MSPLLVTAKNTDQLRTRALPYLPLHTPGACQQEDSSTSTHPAAQPHARADASDSCAASAPSQVVGQTYPDSGKRCSRMVPAHEHASRDVHSRATSTHHKTVFQPPTEGVRKTRWWCTHAWSRRPTGERPNSVAIASRRAPDSQENVKTRRLRSRQPPTSRSSSSCVSGTPESTPDTRHEPPSHADVHYKKKDNRLHGVRFETASIGSLPPRPFVTRRLRMTGVGSPSSRPRFRFGAAASAVQDEDDTTQLSTGCVGEKK